MDNPTEDISAIKLHTIALGFVHQGQLETALQLFKQAIAKNNDPVLHEKLTSDRIITEFLIGTKAQYRRTQRAKRILSSTIILLFLGLLAAKYRPIQHFIKQKWQHLSMQRAPKPLESPIAPPPPSPILSTPPPVPSTPTPKISIPSHAPSPRYKTITNLSAPLAFPTVKKPHLTHKPHRSPLHHKHHRKH